MASPQAAVMRVLEKSRVSPPPRFVPQEPSVPLTSFDIIWLYTAPVENLFFYHYPYSTESFIQSHLPNLKSSLSTTLQAFYILAGNIRRTPDSDDRFEIYYTAGDAVAFTIVESYHDFHQLSSGGKRDYSKLHSLVPRLSKSSAAVTTSLLAVQVTVFPKHGVCIGITIHHSVGDGTSAIRFLKNWALACKSGILESPSVLYDRAVIPQPPGLYSMQYNMLMQSRANQAAEKSDLSPLDNPVFASFTLGLPQIQWLKQRAAASAAKPVRCSTFVMSCAYVWVCLIKAQGLASHETAHFLFGVDCRGRLDLPVPAAYFGNFLRPCFADANVGELIGEDGVVAATAKIGKAIEELNDGVMRGAEGWGERIRSLMGKRLVSVAGSPKFKIYDIDFGLGRPLSVEVLSIEKTGAISLAEARDDGQGIEIGLALEKHEMDEFEIHFYRGVEFQQDDL